MFQYAMDPLFIAIANRNPVMANFIPALDTINPFWRIPASLYLGSLIFSEIINKELT